MVQGKTTLLVELYNFVLPNRVHFKMQVQIFFHTPLLKNNVTLMGTSRLEKRWNIFTSMMSALMVIFLKVVMKIILMKVSSLNYKNFQLDPFSTSEWGGGGGKKTRWTNKL